jgi:uncharacterized protein YndB with AHSA1/START domain
MTMTATKGTARVTLPADNQILITREFAAPRRLVYRAWTEPELVARWWHAERGTVKSIDIDLRVGGAWRYVMTAGGGFEVAFHGEYREIAPDERLVTTEVFEGAPEHPALTTATFAEQDGGGTVLTILTEHDSRESRDMVIASGMEGGLQVALDLAEELALSLA